jgi:pimeloyl-ACP methyl ester carboxylesterase
MRCGEAMNGEPTGPEPSRAVEEGFLRRFFTYQPHRDVGGTPADAGLAFEEIPLRTSDGIRIVAWWIPAAGARLALLWFHGNAGNMGHRVREAEQLHRLGVSSLLVEYRGYGRSEGRPSERGLALDAEAALAWLEGEGGVPRDRIVLYGRSLGAAVAGDLASRATGFAGLVLVTPFTSLRDVAPRKVRLPFARWLAGPGYDLESRMSGITCPTLIVAGGADDLTPLDMAERLRDAGTTARLHVVSGGGHLSTHLERDDGRPGFAEELRAFLDSR